MRQLTSVLHGWLLNQSNGTSGCMPQPQLQNS